MNNSTTEIEKAMDPTDQIHVMNECFQSVSMKKDDSEAVLKRAFLVLSKDHNNAHISKDDVVRAILHVDFGVKLTLKEVKETIHKVKLISNSENQEQINYDEFIMIVKVLVEPTMKAYKTLCMHDGKKIVLYGKSGVGKTWTAQKIAGRAIRKGEFDVAIWVYLNRIYEGLSLHESIAYQLSVLTDFEKSEAEESKKKQELEKELTVFDKSEEAKKKQELEKEKGKQEEPEKDKETKKRGRIEKKIREELRKKKKLLLVLDNEGSKMKLNWYQEDGKDGKKKRCLKLDGNGESIDLGAILALDEKEQYFKVLITTTNQPTDSEDTVGLMVRPLTLDELKSLVFQQMDEVINPDENHEIKELVEFFISKSERLPAEILLMARVVSSFWRSDSGMKKLLEDKEILEKEEGSKLGNVLIRGYERLPKSVLIDCYSSETPDRHFLHRGGMVNFNELISYWIIEGHLGHFDRIEDAYKEGHRVLMELMHCCLLEKQEGDYIAPSGVKFNFDIHDRNEFYRKIHGGLGVTYDMKLGRVAWDNGIIKTVNVSGQEVQKPSTLFIDGNHIGEKSPADTLFWSSNELFESVVSNPTGQEWKKQSALMLDNHEKLPPADSLFTSLTELENLAVFSPTGQHFQRPVGMKKLRLLVLRGCQYLNTLNPYFELGNNKKKSPKPLRRTKSSPPPSQIENHNNPTPSPRPIVPQDLETLSVLEISGPSLLSEIPESLFEKMSNLKTLNMSHLPIKKLPSLFYKLTKIEFLILRGCPSFEELEILTNLKDLQTIDLSGSTSFTRFHDKSLHVNDKLQILNLSQTNIKTIPLINSNPLLKFISLKDCTVLQRIRQIGKLTNLQIFDISGATEVEEFRDPSLEKLKSLVILDVSRTAIRRLPANICNPRYLYVQGCPNIKRLPPVEDFTKVEVIDLSGSSHLEEIRKEFFSNMECLRELNLSNTSVKHIPFLSSLGCLRRLLLVECQHLEKLEKLSALKELEFLDLSGCKNLMEIEDDSFDQMNCLQYLNMSEVKLDHLPSLSKLMKLKELYVRDCPNIKELRGIEGLPVLDVLDYSGTFLKPTPSFSNPDRPRVLGVDIENIDHKEMLNRLSASFESDEVYESTDQQNVEFRQEDLRQCKWSVSAVVTVGEALQLRSSVYGSHFLQLLMKHPSLLSKNLRRFHLLVYPTEKEASSEADKMLYTSEVALRDIYFEQVSQEKMERCLEIREFDNVPPFLGCLLKQAQFVVLIDNAFFKSLLDLGVDNIMDMKACWIERCDQLEHVILSEKEEGDTKKLEEPTKSKGDQTRESAKSDGKPKPAKSEGDQPEERVKNKGNQIGESSKSKGEPGELVESEVDQTGESAKQSKSKDEPGEPSNSQSEPGELAKSNDEPKEPAGRKDEPGEPANRQGEPAESTSSKDEPGEPSNSQSEPRELAKSNDEPREPTESKGEPGEPANRQGEPTESTNSKDEPGEPTKSKGEPVKSKDELEEMTECKGEPGKDKDEPGELTKSKGETEKNFADILEKLEILWISNGLNLKSIFKGDISFKNLKSLYLEYCPQISIICSSSLQLQSLEILYVKYCQKLVTLFTDDTAQLKKLTELHLWGLQDLKRIDCIPSLRTLRVGECPLLEHIINASAQGHDGQEFVGFKNLETLQIKFCDKLKTICEQEDTLYFPNLWELELSGLQELKRIDHIPSLRTLRVGECPLLEHIINASTQCHVGQEFEGHGNLETLHIKFCDKLKTICEEEDASCFPNLRELELLALPELEKIACAAPPFLHNLRVSECSSVQHIFEKSNNLGDVRIVEVKYCDALKTMFGVGGLDLEKLEKMELLRLPEVQNVNGGKLSPSLTEKCMVWGCPKLTHVEESRIHESNDARNPSSSQKYA